MISQIRADVALCDLSAPGRREPAEMLRSALRYLCHGGRLVMWTAWTLAERLQKLIGSAGYTSIIVGRVATDSGSMIVATGILNNKAMERGRTVAVSVVNIDEKFEKIEDLHSYKIIAQMNDCHTKLVRMKREFIWHKHPETDEAFW